MFRISGSIYFFILLTVLGIGFVVWFYYRTIPAVSVTYKVIFIVLRSMALLLILLVFFGTILQLHFIREQKADIVLLCDNSASLQISDKGKKRSLVLKELLQSPSWQHLRQRYHIHPYTFAENTYQRSDDFLDSLLFQGRGTDIAQALIAVTEEKYKNPPRALLLISDGNYTIGDNPIRIAHQLQIPVYTVAIGDTREKSDILITQVLTNDITYKDNITPCAVSIQGSGF
ncbi:MAG: VWA domain-containing protein, partial [bacterium]